MTTALWILFALFWLLQPILCFGMTYGYFQREFPLSAPERQRNDIQTASIFAWAAVIFGPILTVIVFLLSDWAKHGIKFR